MLSDWILRRARSLANAVVSASAVIEFEEVIIDGAFPPDVRSRMARLLDSRLGQLDKGGIAYPKITQGSFGAAAIHINARYMVKQEPRGI